MAVLQGRHPAVVESAGIPPKAEGLWAAAGSWKDDPYRDDLLKEIYRQRGRPMTEEG